jgi:protein-export membrane protein SecD
MWFAWNSKLWYYVIVLIFSLIILFFTGTSLTDFKINGITYFRKGLDIAWWVRLTYKVDMSKYREIYSNEQEFQTIRKRALNIITKNIDNRISKLGVSDYESKIMTLTDGDYLVIEIWGLNDVEEAKKQIWKTVELEFKLFNSNTGSNNEELQKRKKVAQDLFGQVQKNPNWFAQIVQWKESNDIFYNNFTGKKIEELPQIYIKYIEQIEQLQPGKVLPIILSGVYVNFTDNSWSNQTTSGFVIVKLNSTSVTKWWELSDQKIKSIAENKKMSFTDNIVKEKSLLTGIFNYNESKKTLTIDGGEIFSWSEAYKVDLYIVPKTAINWTENINDTTTNVSPEDEVKQKAIVKQIQDAIDTKKSIDTVSWAQLLLSQQWVDYNTIAGALPNYTYNPNETYKIWEDINATYVFKFYDHKASNESVYRTLILWDVKKEESESLIASIASEKLYNIEDIFVRDHVTRIPAIDEQWRVLNGAFFQMATIWQDSTGKPAVTIHFNEEWKAIFCDITEKNIKQQMAIFVGWVIKTAPTIQDKICGWQAIINGQQSIEERDILIKDLNEWALPAQLILSHEEKIDATLWAKAFHGALIAWMVWLILIFVYMVFLYNFEKATICMIMLGVYLIILLAFLKMIGYALSLASIAAILLNIGISVDVCILVFERLKEELEKGKSLTWAIQESYHRSYPAIRDGNISIGLIWLLLFAWGINIFKWFGTMMLINLILTFTVVLPIIKEIMMYYYTKKR